VCVCVCTNLCVYVCERVCACVCVCMCVCAHVCMCMCVCVRAHARVCGFVNVLVGLVIALRPHTPKHIRGGWSHSTDTSEPIVGYETNNILNFFGYETNNILTDQSGIRTSYLSITSPIHLPVWYLDPTKTDMT
jgi:hypothetical protein